MKKSLIALAVAGAFVAPAMAATSNVDVYGILNVAIQDTNQKNYDPQVTDNYSRIGFIISFVFATLYALSLMTTLIYLFGRSHSYIMKYGDHTTHHLTQAPSGQESAFMSGPQYGQQPPQHTPTPFLTPAAAQPAAYNIR